MISLYDIHIFLILVNRSFVLDKNKIKPSDFNYSYEIFYPDFQNNQHWMKF